MDAGWTTEEGAACVGWAETCVPEGWFFFYFPEECQNLAGGYLFRNISLVG